MIIKKLSRLIVWLFFAAYGIGCAHLFPPPEDQFQALQILKDLVDNSAEIKQYKALAHVRLEWDGRAVSGRLAMAAVIPDKLRVEWLNMMGQPITALAGDGQKITIFSHTDHKVHRLHQSPTAMASLIHIPIGIEDLQKIVIGSPPLPADTTVQLKASDSDSHTLVFKNRWHNVVATLNVDRLTSRAIAMQTFSGQGELQYEINWLRWRQEGTQILPAEMVFKSKSGQRLTLTMDRFWPNADVPESIFVLDVP